MDLRVVLFVLLVLGAGVACAARLMTATESELSILISEISAATDLSTVISEITDSQLRSQDLENEIRTSQQFAMTNQVCTLCEEYAALAIDYLAQNKTQTEIMDALHVACSKMHSLEEKCITLVDYYASLFFLEISSVQPEEFCQKVNLCQEIVTIASKLHENSCGVCQRAMSEVIAKLKDPDTQLEIIEVLLKACESLEKNAQKCKRLVFEYGPVVLANAEQFLENTDICTILHACKSSAAEQKSTVLKADS